MTLRLRGSQTSPLQLVADFQRRLRRAFIVLTGADPDAVAQSPLTLADSAVAVVQLADLSQAPYRTAGRSFIAKMYAPVAPGKFQFWLLWVPRSSKKLAVVDVIDIIPDAGNVELALVSVRDDSILLGTNWPVMPVEEMTFDPAAATASGLAPARGGIDGLKLTGNGTVTGLTQGTDYQAFRYLWATSTGLPPAPPIRDANLVLTPGVGLLVWCGNSATQFNGHVQGRYFDLADLGSNFP